MSSDPVAITIYYDNIAPQFTFNYTFTNLYEEAFEVAESDDPDVEYDDEPLRYPYVPTGAELDEYNNPDDPEGEAYINELIEIYGEDLFGDPEPNLEDYDVFNLSRQTHEVNKVLPKS
jgi:hypothetical protein